MPTSNLCMAVSFCFTGDKHHCVFVSGKCILQFVFCISKSMEGPVVIFLCHSFKNITWPLNKSFMLSLLFFLLFPNTCMNWKYEFHKFDTR